MGWGSVKGERETGLARLRAWPVPRTKARERHAEPRSPQNPRRAAHGQPATCRSAREDLATEALSVCQRTLNVAALAEADAVQP